MTRYTPSSYEPKPKRPDIEDIQRALSMVQDVTHGELSINDAVRAEMSDNVRNMRLLDDEIIVYRNRGGKQWVQRSTSFLKVDPIAPGPSVLQVLAGDL